MIKNRLYLVTGIKYYGAYQGDPCEEIVKLLVPADDEEDARKSIRPNSMDEITSINLLYEVVEGCGYDENGCWSIMNGFDGDAIFNIATVH